MVLTNLTALLTVSALLLLRAPDPSWIVDVHKNKRRIRCPKCQWEPARHDTWCCSPGCGHVWNTFETRGLCPGCAKAWMETACLRCNAWSPHDDWYEDADE
jgi:hypothetical protein